MNRRLYSQLVDFSNVRYPEFDLYSLGKTAQRSNRSCKERCQTRVSFDVAKSSIDKTNEFEALSSFIFFTSHTQFCTNENYCITEEQPEERLTTL